VRNCTELYEISLVSKRSQALRYVKSVLGYIGVVRPESLPEDGKL